jgi:hypothetical protein
VRSSEDAQFFANVAAELPTLSTAQSLPTKDSGLTLEKGNDQSELKERPVVVSALFIADTILLAKSVSDAVGCEIVVSDGRP